MRVFIAPPTKTPDAKVAARVTESSVLSASIVSLPFAACGDLVAQQGGARDLARAGGAGREMGFELGPLRRRGGAVLRKRQQKVRALARTGGAGGGTFRFVSCRHRSFSPRGRGPGVRAAARGRGTGAIRRCPCSST